MMESLWAALNSIPEDSIAITVYLVGSLIALSCWYSIARRLPKPIGGITWLFMFAVLLTPTVSAGTNAAIAPAVFALIFGVLTKDSALVGLNVTYIAVVLGLGFVVGFLWNKYKAKSSQQNSQNNSSPL
jgi:hypothetical protein